MDASSNFTFATDRERRAADATEAVWFLVGRLYPNEPVRHLPVHSSPFSIGRRPTTSLCLESKAVSSLHAVIIDDGGALILRDAGSTNGTFVNGQRVWSQVTLKQDDLIQFADVAFRVLKQSSATSNMTASADVFDHAMALVQFDRLMNERAVIPYYQPIVSLKDEEILGFEVLARSRIHGLEMPSAMFSAAAQLSLEVQLSQMIRWLAIQQTMTLNRPLHVFLNTDPAELQDVSLIASVGEIRRLSPRQEITLEIHERAITNTRMMKDLRAALHDLNVRLAFDDFGAGQARLIELAEVRPDYLKFDMSLIRSIHEASHDHQQMIAALVQMVNDMGVLPLAEGIETTDEGRVCSQLGFELAQGYYFGKPAPLIEGTTR